jgi:hypothetical protein
MIIAQLYGQAAESSPPRGLPGHRWTADMGWGMVQENSSPGQRGINPDGNNNQ